MSYDERDAAADYAYEQLSEEIIKEFTSEIYESALKKASPHVDHVRAVLAEARKVQEVSPSAVCLFAGCAAELIFRNLLLEPLVSGVIHNHVAMTYIVNAILSQKKYRKLVTDLVKTTIKIDLLVYKRKDATEHIFRETELVASRRNSIIHEGEFATDQDAQYALAVADELLNGVFGDVLTAANLQMLSVGEKRSIWHQHLTIVPKR